MFSSVGADAISVLTHPRFDLLLAVMNDNYYPQDISEKEKSLGFRHLLIDGVGTMMGSQIKPHPVPVVACVRSASDVWIKILTTRDTIAYSHTRFGHSEITPYCGAQWHPIRTLISKVEKIISDVKGGIHEETFPGL